MPAAAARAEIGLPGPLLDLPTDGPADRLWQYFSTDGFYKIPVGNSTFDFPAVDDLRGGMNGFPDRASIEKLRFYGIRTVVLHLQMPKLPGIVGYALAEPPNARGGCRQADRRAGRHAPARRLARDLRDRPRAGGAAPADGRRGDGAATSACRRHAPGAEHARARERDRSARRSALCAVVLVGLAFASMIQNWSDNQSSHYDLIRALDAGRTTIDAGPTRRKTRRSTTGTTTRRGRRASRSTRCPSTSC